MKKRLLLSVVAAALLASLTTGTALAASAATKETSITEGILTSRGSFNIVEWERTGESADAYAVDNQGTFLRYSAPTAWGFWMLMGDAVSGTKDVTVEWDVKDLTYDTYFLPTYWVTTYAGASQNTDFFYSEYALGSYPQLTKDTRYQLVYGTDGSLKISTAAIKDDGSYAEFTQFKKIENYATIPESADDKYYFGFMGHTANGGAVGGKIDIDNVKFMSGTDVLINQDFESDVKIEKGGIPQKGTITVVTGDLCKICEVKVIEPAADNKLFCTESIAVDEDMKKCVSLAGGIRIDEYAEGDKIGIAFGLENADAPVTGADTSFVYFENKEGLTYVNVQNGNATGTAQSLGKNYVGEFIDFEMEIDNAGNTVLKIGEATYDLKVENVAGHAAIGHVLGGKASYAVSKDFSLKNYSYVAGTGKSAENNFNTGYIDKKNFSYAGYPATMMADSTKAEAIKFEDGALFFKGTSDGSYFGFEGTYADFILEFDYTCLAVEDRPALNENWAYGYSGLGIYFGANQYAWSGDSNHGKAIYFIDNFSGTTLLQFAYWNEGGTTKNKTLETYTTQGGTNVAEGMVGIYKKTNRIKVVAANNVVKLYAVTLEDGKALSEYKRSDYKLLGTYECKDTYGLVNIATTESGYFKIDNLKITNIDAKTAEEVDAKVEAYVDFAPIADTIAPERLSTPVLTLEDNVARWNAVEKATGYELTIGEETITVSAETLSYTFGQTEAGTYELSVKALYAGEENYTDSKAATISYTVEAGGGSSSSGSGSVSSGCGSAFGGMAGLAAVTLAGAALALARKKKN